MHQFECLAVGISGSEGPLATRDGRILVVEPSSGSLIEIKAAGQKEIVAQTGGVPAGLQLHRDGSIWIADMRLGILRLGTDGVMERIVQTYNGQPIRGCNDCAFDSQGNLYFTAPSGSSRDNHCGELFCRLLSGEVLLIDDGFAFCNGLAVSADDRYLIVAETFTKRLYRYTLEAPGRAAPASLFATVPGDHRGGPDGIDFDSQGDLIVTNLGGAHLEVFYPDGSTRERIPLPFAKPSNVHFRGPDDCTLLITEHSNHSLWQTPWPCPGQRQFGWS